ncbi:Putative uncharacterized protein [Moritella viscosa]|uniref:Uncharacterized protein n=1 Tax=Moritella viscosa TaxID=80854 RepID=A0ABY1HJG6_9GAMM|nr:Putative uncharacterized protein [Moritella viscosa]SHO28100.1 Putative uncharacterized protein [Moritella viscosa]
MKSLKTLFTIMQKSEYLCSEQGFFSRSDSPSPPHQNSALQINEIKEVHN